MSVWKDMCRCRCRAIALRCGRSRRGRSVGASVTDCVSEPPCCAVTMRKQEGWTPLGDGDRTGGGAAGLFRERERDVVGTFP